MKPDAMAMEADVLRCGYDVGFFDKTDIIRWADQQIEASEIPCPELLDLSMVRQTHPIDVMNLLRVLGASEPATSIQTRIGFIGLLLARDAITVQLAIQGLWALLQEPGINQEQKSEIYSLDDGYDLALAGAYGTLDDIERDLRGFVMPYAERLARLYPHLISSTEQTDARRD